MQLDRLGLGGGVLVTGRPAPGYIRGLTGVLGK